MDKRNTTAPVMARGEVTYSPRFIPNGSTSRGVLYESHSVALKLRPITYRIHEQLQKEWLTFDRDVTLQPMLTDDNVELDSVEVHTPAVIAKQRKWRRKQIAERDIEKVNRPIVGLISSINPAPALELTVKSLLAGGASRVIVMDDGSYAPEAESIFNLVEAAGGEVIHMPVNGGKAKALMTGFASIPADSIIIQTDDDTLGGKLAGPARLIMENKADIVDIRVETVQTSSLLGVVQELDYWLINAWTKRIQNLFRARLWMSGASVMYSYEAGKELLLSQAYTITEDTEGLFRARSKGFRVRYYSKHDAEFLTMVPEDFRSLNKQWKRWATGNGQVIGIYGLGAGNFRIALINALAWIELLVLPIPATLHYGILPAAEWAFGYGVLMGFVGALRLKRWRFALVGIFLPVISAAWAFYAPQGVFLAWRQSRTGKMRNLTWVPPTRTAIEVTAN